MTVRVKALARGYYADTLRRPGDVFTLTRAEHFSPKWMVRVPDDAPEHTTTAQEALKAKCEEMSPLGHTRRVAWPADEDNEAGGVLSEFDPLES